MSDPASVTITQQDNFRFLVDFGAGIPALQTDEPAPLGAGEGPSPDQLLMAAVINCLSASLFFALKKFKQDAGGITTTATARMGRDADKRLRMDEIAVTVRLGQRRRRDRASRAHPQSVRGLLHRHRERATRHPGGHHGRGCTGGAGQGARCLIAWCRGAQTMVPCASNAIVAYG